MLNPLQQFSVDMSSAEDLRQSYINDATHLADHRLAQHFLSLAQTLLRNLDPQPSLSQHRIYFSVTPGCSDIVIERLDRRTPPQHASNFSWRATKRSPIHNLLKALAERMDATWAYSLDYKELK